jgi:hypothetical protein
VTNGQHSSAMCLFSNETQIYLFHLQVRGVVEVVRFFINIVPITVANFTSKQDNKLSGPGG